MHLLKSWLYPINETFYGVVLRKERNSQKEDLRSVFGKGSLRSSAISNSEVPDSKRKPTGWTGYDEK